MRKMYRCEESMITQHSCQKRTEVVGLAKKKGVKKPLEEEMTDLWLEDFLYPEKKQEASGRHLMDFNISSGISPAEYNFNAITMNT